MNLYKVKNNIRYQFSRIKNKFFPAEYLYSPSCVTRCLQEYYGEKNWMWMVLSGRGLIQTQSRWSKDMDIFKYEHHGFVFEFEYKSCPAELKIDKTWPFPGTHFRVMVTPPFGNTPDVGMLWRWCMSRKEFEQLLRWIERDYAPALNWAGENEYDETN